MSQFCSKGLSLCLLVWVLAACQQHSTKNMVPEPPQKVEVATSAPHVEQQKIYYYGMETKTREKTLEQSRQQAQIWQEKAQQGIAEAQYQYGMHLYHGLGLKRDWSQAVYWFAKAAEQGSSKADYQLAWVFRYGYGIPRDPLKSLKFFRRTALNNDHTATYQMGRVIEDLGTQPGFQPAEKYYLIAAVNGHAMAQYRLGLHYLKDQQDPLKLTQALTWLEKAAQQKVPDALYTLGRLHYYEEIKNSDFQKGSIYLIEAADLGHELAQQEFGTKVLLLARAQRGEAHAQVQLGLMNLYGYGVKRNTNEAFRWFQQAADQNNPEAQYYLGWMYYYGVGTKSNNQLAANWFQKSAKQGYDKAEHQLGEMLYYGKGMRKNFDDASKWIKRSKR